MTTVRFSQEQEKRGSASRLSAILLSLLLVMGCTNAKAESSISDAADFNTNVWVPGPLDEFQMRFSPTWFPGITETQALAAHRLESELREEFIARCMAELGFDYIPVPADHFRHFSGGWIREDEEIPPGTRAFAETYGFGHATERWTFWADPEQFPANPNAQFWDQMSPSEYAAWRYALTGIETGWGVIEDGVGCQGQANELANQRRQPPDGFESLREEIWALEAALDSDPRVLQLNHEWTSCMITTGFSEFTSPAEANQILQQQWNQVANLGFVPPDQRARMVAHEIAVALADWDCRFQLEYDLTRRAIYLEMQQEFVDRHRADLEGWALQMDYLWSQ